MDLDRERLDALVATLPAGTLAIGGNIAGTIAGNIVDPAACQAAVDQTVAHFGALDGLINNAGIDNKFRRNNNRHGACVLQIIAVAKEVCDGTR